MSRAIRNKNYNEAMKELLSLGVELNSARDGWGTKSILAYIASIRLFNILYPNARELLQHGFARNVNLLKLHKEVD